MDYYELQRMHDRLNKAINPLGFNNDLLRIVRGSTDLNSSVMRGVDIARSKLNLHDNYSVGAVSAVWDSVYNKSTADFSLKMDAVHRGAQAATHIALDTQLGLTNSVYSEAARYNDVLDKIRRLGHYEGVEGAMEKLERISAMSLRFREYTFDEEINDYTDEIEEESQSEISSIIINDGQRLQRIITDVYNDNSKLFTMEPNAFEEMIAELLDDRGFDVKLTKKTKDNGFDILCIDSRNNLFPIKFLVECKRYSEHRKVGVEIVRSFKEVIATEQANMGILVTTSYFTSGANKKKSENPYLLDFRDKDRVIDWVNNYSKK